MTRPRLLVTALLAGACAASSGRSAAMIVETNSPAVGSGDHLVEAVGLETLGGVFTPLLQTGCPLPCSCSKIFSTAADRQDQISITLYRGNVSRVSNAKPLGQFRIEGIPPMPRGKPKIEVVLVTRGHDLVLEARDATQKRACRIVRVP